MSQQELYDEHDIDEHETSNNSTNYSTNVAGYRDQESHLDKLNKKRKREMYLFLV